MKRFRRAQLLCHLVERDMVTPGDMVFGSRGNLTGIHAEGDTVLQAINSGIPFLTGGCPGRQGDIACNRPFGSYRPGEPFRDFPFQPTSEDICKIKKELSLDKTLPPGVEIL